jgi:hypothetical protein
VLVFGFIEKRQLAAQTNRNSVFLGREAHILNWLYIIVLYKIFTGFQIFEILTQNPMMLAFDFTEKQQFRQKLTKTLYFLTVKLIFHIGYT